MEIGFVLGRKIEKIGSINKKLEVVKRRGDC